jgi:hypothetical protein
MGVNSYMVTTYATPGNGSILLNGNTYTINLSLDFLQNGVAVPGGSDTGQIDLYNGTIYAADATTGNWYAFDGVAIFTLASAPPNLPGSPPAPPPSPTPTPSPSPGPAAGTQIVIDLTKTVGVVSPYIWGVGTEGLNSPAVNDYGAAINSGWQTTYRQQQWRLFRHNTQGSLFRWPGGNNQNTTMQNNWINGLKAIWQQASGPEDTSRYQQVFTFGSAPNSGGNQPGSTAQAVTLANWFKSNGFPIYYWEYWNEPDSDLTDYVANYNAFRNAIKSVDANYKVGGPTTSFARSDFLSQGLTYDFVSYHTYVTGGYSNNFSLFNTIVNRQQSDIATIRSKTSVPIFLGEWNIDYNGTEPMMQTIDGAIFGALYTLGARATIDSNITMGAIWTIGENSNFTIVNDDGSNVRPMGYMLGQLGRIMGGNQVSASIGSGLTNVVCLASVQTSTFSIAFINYSSTAQTINLQGLPAQTGTYWELSPTHSSPPIQQSLTITNSMSLSLPSRSLVTLTGNLAVIPPAPPSPPPAPPPPSPPPAPPPTPAPATRNYWQNPGGDGSSGTLGGASVWVTQLGSGAVAGLATDPDTIALRHGGAINPSLSMGDVIWNGKATDPLTTFTTSPDAYQRDSALSANLHVPLGAYQPGPTFGNSLGRNIFNIWDISGNQKTAWSFVDLNTSPITGGQVVAAEFGETDDPTSDHFGEDQETGNYGYDGIPGMLTAYDFDSTQNPNYPNIQHMLRYLHDPKFLKSGSSDGTDNLGPNSWPQKKQDSQSAVPYTGQLVAGTTVFIPQSTTMPSGLTAEGQVVFKCLQTYGALWRGSIPGGFHLSCSQDVSPTVIAHLNTDLPKIVQYLCPLRNQHVGGQSFATSPKNGPGPRVGIGTPPLASSPPAGPAPSPVTITIGQVSQTFTSYWQALSAEIAANTDILYGFVVHTGDPQGSSGTPDDGVINTPAATIIGNTFGPLKKG